MTRPASPTARLIKLGFGSAVRAAGLLEDRALAPHLTAAQKNDAPLEEALGQVADPDGALLLLVRLAESCEKAGRAAQLGTVLATDTSVRRRLLAVLGASSNLGDVLVANPQMVDLLHAERESGRVLDLTPAEERAIALQAVGADPEDERPVAHLPEAQSGADVLRRTYRSRLLSIAAADLTAADPLETFTPVAAALADIAGAALDAALAVARAEALAEGRPVDQVRLAVLGMGKTGGRELNYISDVDVIHVAAPVEPQDGTPALSEAEVLTHATWLAQRLATLVAGTSGEPALWTVDANLRPEGKDGPLVRTLDSYQAYYKRWAQSWEFQALLKARTVAGDFALGQKFEDLVEPMVWEAAGQENFVTDAQAMRRRVESLVPSKEAERQIKLGRGGLRDVEFTVQLLQLVHGRTDEAVRTRSTLDGLTALAAAGYVARDDAETLHHHYRFLRSLEHRIQMHRMRRTHVVPSGEADLRRLGRAMRQETTTTAEGLEATWRDVRREVRTLHEAIFYRPLLATTAQLSKDDISLTPEAAKARLAAIGFRAPDRAMQQINALTEGISRRAAIQRQLLPVMLGWFAEGPQPDAGLLGFRRLSDELGSTHWYLKLLRDSGTAAHALAHALSHSTYVANELPEIPEAVQWLDEEEDLVPRSREALQQELRAVLSRRDEEISAAKAVRYLRRRELLRSALGDVLGTVDHERSTSIITPVGDLVIEGALRIAEHEELLALGRSPKEPVTRFLIVAMGRTGGQEAGYASDADVLFVHDPLPDVPQDVDVAAHALAVATKVRSLLGDPMEEPSYPLDGDLRPEGRQGPLIRSFDSYAEYYSRWAEAWEKQALLRARPAAGNTELGERFLELIAPLRHPEGGFAATDQREIRRIKARVESERMPRGVDPTRHLKLGRGSLSDVEWTAQLLQARHAGDVPAMRSTSTLEVLHAAADADLLAREDAQILSEAWTLCTRLRAAIVLATGRLTGSKLDQLPHDTAELETVARLLGYEPGKRLDLEEDYLRLTRRCRGVVERVFYG